VGRSGAGGKRHERFWVIARRASEARGNGIAFRRRAELFSGGWGKFAGLSAEIIEARYGYFFREMQERVVPNMRRLQNACRKAGVEVIYTVIESLTLDGRDLGLDYKIRKTCCQKPARVW
jgi:hypothetical protein